MPDCGWYGLSWPAYRAERIRRPGVGQGKGRGITKRRLQRGRRR